MTPYRRAIYATVGMRIKRIRRDVGMSQAALADVLGLARTSITNIEKGRQCAQLHTVVEIADALGVDVSEIVRFGGKP